MEKIEYTYYEYLFLTYKIGTVSTDNLMPLFSGGLGKRVTDPNHKILPL